MASYQNPIIKGTYPDPSICRVGEEYYLVTSTFCYFPGVPIFHSRDLIHWTQIGHCLTRPSQLNLDNLPPQLGIFAPTLRYHDGRFYMITTLVGNGGHFYVWTEDPAGDWSDPIWLDQAGIDPSLLFDDDGRIYLCSTGGRGAGGIFQSEIDLETGKPLAPPKLIWSGMGGRHPEGPHLYHIGDTYYLMISEGGTEYAHRVTLARSKSPWGPFEPCPHNPIFTHMNLPDHPLQATGHADIVQDHTGRWWMVFLATRPHHGYPPVHHLGRETNLVPVAWDDAGWLVVNGGKPAELEMETETLQLQEPTPQPTRDDFDGSKLDFVWNFIRTPRSDFWSLTARPGWLRLAGTGAKLDDNGSPAFVGRRQQDFESEVRALLDYSPQQPGDEAGLTVYQNGEHHYDLFVTVEEEQRVIVVRQRIGSLIAPVARKALPQGDITLIIQTTEKEYTFAYADAQGNAHTLATARSRYLASEVAGGFTGVFIGMYVYGDRPADFDWFEVRTPDEKVDVEHKPPISY